MADDQAPPRPSRTPVMATHARQRREAAEERRARQTADAIATQEELKRQAAERRARKEES